MIDKMLITALCIIGLMGCFTGCLACIFLLVDTWR